MPQGNLEDLIWPRGGVVENSPESSPAENTTQDALNVRNFDAYDRRNRGGQRTGIERFVDQEVNGSADIQYINTQTQVVALSEDAGFLTKYANPGTLSTDDIDTVSWHPDGDFIAMVTHGGTSGTGTAKVLIYPWNAGTGFGTVLADAATLSNRPSFAVWHPDGTYLAVGENDSSARILIYPFSKVSGLGTPSILSSFGSSASTLLVQWFSWHPDGDQFAFSYHGSSSTDPEWRAYSFDSGTGVIGSQVGSTLTISSSSTANGIAFHPSGTAVVVIWGSTPFKRAYAYSKTTGFGSAIGSDVASAAGASSDNASPGDISWHPDGTFLAVNTSSTSPKVQVFPFNTSTGFSAAISNPATLPAGNGRGVAFSADGEFLAVATSSSPFLQVYPFSGVFGVKLDDPGTAMPGSAQGPAWHPTGRAIACGSDITPFIHAYEFQLATVNPSARRQRLVAVAGGSVYRSGLDYDAWALTNSGSAALITSGVVRGVEAFQDMFFCDSTAAGYKYLDYPTNTMTTWTPTAGALPVGTADTSIGCRIIALYRGRVCLSGLLEEPQNWFCSASGDPFNWDYSPATSSPIQAVAGNNSNVGELGDVITCLAPFSDDIMMMGGVNSLWVMRGDPAAGGAIDNISRQIGVVGPEAYTWDTSGNFYFFGQNGLYRMAQGGSEPLLISKGKMDKTFSDINTKDNRVWLVYDALWQGVHIFVIPTSQPASAPLHYYWDERNDSFWIDQYPAAIGPTAVHMFNSDDPDRRGLLMGGFDGYVRKFSDTAEDDDGTVITSRITFPPIAPGRGFASSRVEDLWVHLDNSSDAVTMDVFGGDTIEQARTNQAAGTPRVRRVLAGGRNTPLRQRIAQNALLVRLNQTGLNGAAASWAFEQGGFKQSVVNRMHGKRV